MTKRTEHLIKEAFAESNAFLQSGKIEICVGKSAWRERVTDKARRDLVNIFQEIRKLRNKVAIVGDTKILDATRFWRYFEKSARASTITPLMRISITRLLLYL
jgi:hypothetical protein